ncbi:MAG: hypothetical protein ABIH82_00025 [Candidatus Woesearchaeota archaeon]
MNLDELASTTPVVLLDASIIDKDKNQLDQKGSTSSHRRLRGLGYNFGEFSLTRFQYWHVYVGELLSWVKKHESVRTVPEVLSEMERFKEILRKDYDKRVNRDSKTEYLYQQIELMYKRFLRVLRNRTVDVTDRRKEGLIDFLRDYRLHLPREDGFRKTYLEENTSFGDVYLVAEAAVSKSSAAIVTGDFDILNLVQNGK